jgi:hypothetical protein
VNDEYLTVAEVAARFKLKPKTVRNRMHDGTWRRGVHWFRRPGIGPRFRWSILVASFEAPDETPPSPGAAYGADVPPPRRGRPPRRLTSLHKKNMGRRAEEADGTTP